MGFLQQRVNVPSYPPPPAAINTPPIPDWVPLLDPSNDVGAVIGEPIEFTDRDVRLIAGSLPSGTDPNRIEILPLLLREWALVELRWHFAKTALPLLAQQRMRLKKVAKQASALIQALDELDGHDRWALVKQLGVAEGLGLLTVYGNEQNKQRVDEWRSLTATIAAAAAEPMWKPGKGQPRKLVAQLVLQDLAALFEYVAGMRASRVVDPRNGEESGHFLNFARAVWPVIFGGGDRGLLSQLRKWADQGRKKSTLISRIALTHRDWGVISTL